METDPLDEAISLLNLAESDLSAMEGAEPRYSRRALIKEIANNVRKARMIVEEQK